jgi:oxygen-independent coproporphyrinogen-3 oxidase
VPLGVYISVPFCRTKCSFCNFASGVVSKAVYARYVGRVCDDIRNAEALAHGIGAALPGGVNSIYLGGGTPTMLDPPQVEQMFAAVRAAFRVQPEAEITVEIAPGTLSQEMLDALVRCGVNRVSLGVQSFVDEEARSVGRLHTRAVTLDDIARLRASGISNISLDLIAGLPHQTPQSWEYSLAETIATGVPHVSVYMLEVDEDSRLGRELIAGGTRYHAHFVPDEDTTASLYEQACARLNAAGIQQYEISNFARDRSPDHQIARSPGIPSFASLHNLKYWTRQPYLGFGVDAHSMLATNPESRAASREQTAVEAVRFATPESVEKYLAGTAPEVTDVHWEQAVEETYFLGLRLTKGMRVTELAERYGPEAAAVFQEQIAEVRALGLLEQCDGATRLTARGRLLSNEVFQRFVADPAAR